MKRAAIVLLLGAAVIGVSAFAAVATADRSSKKPSAAVAKADRSTNPTSLAPGFYSYDEAKAAGIDVGPLPSEVGLPICDSTTPDPGFASGEDAAATIRAAERKYGEDGPPGRCMADPRLGVYVVGGPIKGMPPGK
jgi:hypothetical protein